MLLDVAAAIRTPKAKSGHIHIVSAGAALCSY
jgi:hypothetical protein